MVHHAGELVDAQALLWVVVVVLLLVIIIRVVVVVVAVVEGPSSPLGSTTCLTLLV